MSSDQRRFAHRGPSWSDLASLGEIKAVMHPQGTERINMLLHSMSLYGAKLALALNRQKGRSKGVLLDFGCGTGRMLRFFGEKGWSVIGTEITPEMLSEARRFGLPRSSSLYLTDGVSIPVRDQSVDMIWVCGVLKYSLFPPGSACRGRSRVPSNEPFIPVYRDIAEEMYRVLKPGSFVVNVEMYVDAEPESFTHDFEQAGFTTTLVRILRRYSGRLEELCEWREWHRLSPRLVMAAGQVCAALRYRFDNPRRSNNGMRDYLFVWSKPNA